jgi:SOS-response transcriptional repressor LexA
MNSQTRKDRLKTLVDVEGSTASFARKYGLDPTYISQMLNGHRNIGEKTARKIEVATGKPTGWLDAAHEPANISPAIARGQFPLISWVQAGNWCEISDPYPPGEAEDWKASPFPGSDRSYLLKVDGNSMYHPDGTGYSHGDIIHVDPNKQPVSGKDVIARTPDGRATFKRYIESQDGAYLEAINPAWPERIIKVPPGTVICGRVIGSWRER